MLQACHLAGEDETHQKGNYFFNITEATTLKCPIIAYQVWDSMLGLSVCKCRRAPAGGGGGGDITPVAMAWAEKRDKR